MTSSISAAYLANNQVAPGDVHTVIVTVRSALSALMQPADDRNIAPPEPAVPIKRSITPDHLVCLEDGKKLKMLKRYLRARYDMTPDDYRARWNLPPDYPMVAPNYARQRSEFARRIGLGRK
ncbi:MucR family transcriptional regulator [Minwuia thermotolerans]|nr:MucR family transcriptional regulator [Minwuia thermotolerans]